MTTPCIHIKQHEAKNYEWALIIGSETICGDVGESSITDCLKASVDTLPPDIFFVEIRYRSIHMGTFNSDELRKTPGAVADCICGMYAELAQSLTASVLM